MSDKTVGRTVAAELARRKVCRYGLSGVRAAVEGQPGEAFTIDGSRWDKDGRLLLSLLPEGADRDAGFPEEVRARLAAGGRLRMISAADLLSWRPPEGYLRDVPPERVVLLSQWPVVCRCWLPAGRRSP
jgi:hypothetical protein